jgi:hypothetical protein
MSFDWTEYLKLAQDLATQPTLQASEEARQRCAISRAYYAALKTAHNFLCSLDPSFVFERMDVHRKVRDKLLLRPDQPSKQLSLELDRLGLQRNKADYENTFDQLAAELPRALLRAQRIIEGIANLK